MPANREVLLARGPYTRDAERALMRRFAINVLVTKNSGGSLTEGKLAAARDLGLPVVMIRRPAAPGAAKTVAANTVDEAVSWVLGWAQAPDAHARAGRLPDRSAGA
jgi:precorrin-6A/cobalt-precorrin-6A reductase